MRVDLFLHQQGIDTTTPAGKAMFQMLGVFSEFERSMIQERVKAGLARARAQGKRLGRPKVVNDRLREAVLQAKREGMTVRKIAARVGASVGTVQGVLSAAVAEAQG
jgi:DNA invertase Pin-like site-specific DNA recombinase